MSIRITLPATEHTREYDFIITSLRYVPTTGDVYTNISFALPPDDADDCYGSYCAVLSPDSYVLYKNKDFLIPEKEELDIIDNFIDNNIADWIEHLLDANCITIAPKDTRGNYIGVPYELR